VVIPPSAAGKTAAGMSTDIANNEQEPVLVILHVLRFTFHVAVVLPAAVSP
jgi:hypothetical protein